MSRDVYTKKEKIKNSKKLKASSVFVDCEKK